MHLFGGTIWMFFQRPSSALGLSRIMWPLHPAPKTLTLAVKPLIPYYLHKILFSRTLPETYIRMILCILIDYMRKHPKIAVSKSSKKKIMVGFGSSNFCRLLETTEFFFYLGLFKLLSSTLPYVF